MFDLDFLLIMIAPHLVLGAAVLAVFLWGGRRKDFFEEE
ncbi:cytochrome bd oxidase small subunit CydS [Salibacterium salarium]